MNYSIIAKSKLPIDFINELNNDFSDRNVEKILEGMSNYRFTTFRVNYLKGNENEVEAELEKNNIEYQKITLTSKTFNSNNSIIANRDINEKTDKNYDINQINILKCNENNYNSENSIKAYIILNKNENELRNLDIYKDGKIYIQSISSMIPPVVLFPKQDEKILDLASAPGSKTTQMATMMNNKGIIIANEVDKVRIEKLKFNVEKQGAKIVKIINEDGTKTDKIEGIFDKILVDVPCSGEGRFIISDRKTYENWSLNMQNKLIDIQKGLIKSAIKLCKIGGEIVYSTCSLGKNENEKIIDWAIKNFDIEIEKVKISIEDSNKKNNFLEFNQNDENKKETKEKYNQSGYDKENVNVNEYNCGKSDKKININNINNLNNFIIKGNNKNLNKQIENTLKILPNKVLEGFYIARIKKLRINSSVV